MENPFALLGGSLVADEHKGDYAAAARLVTEETETGLLAKGILEVLAGAPGAARDTFDRLLELDPEPGVLLPAYSFNSLASTLWGVRGIDVPGVVWFSTDAETLWYHADFDRAQRWTATVQQAPAGPPPPWLQPWLTALVGLLTVRAIWSGSSEPAVLDAAWAMAAAEEQFGPDDHSAWGFLLRVKAERARIAGSDGDARRLLDEAADRYRQGGDVAGAASCAMLAGDWLLAPHASPLTLGLLHQPRLASTARWRGRPSEDAIDGAEQAYRQAEQGFAGCPRGLAELTLRQSCLAEFRGDAEATTALAARAAGAFESCGDERGFRIAATHLALRRLATGIPVDATGIAEELAGWALGRGSPALAHRLGGLAGAWGKYLLHEQGDVLAALRCHELAGEVYRALGAVVSQAQSLVSAAEAHSCAGDQQRAALAAEQAVFALEPALREGHPLLVLAAQQLPVTALHGLSMRYAPTFDDKGLAAAVRRLAPLRDRLRALLASHAGVVETNAGREERFPNEHRLAAENLAFATRVEPILDYVLEQSAWQADWLRAERLVRDGFSARARRELETLLARCRASTDKVPRELAPYVLLGLRRHHEAADAFDAVADGYGVNSLVEVAAPNGQLVYDSPETRRFGTALLRVSFLTAAHDFARAAAAIDELEALRGKEWWRYGPEPWMWLWQLANVAAGTDRLDEAASGYEQAIDALESRRFGASRDSWQASYYGSAAAALIYVAASRCALRRRLPAQALELSERGRGRATADLLATGPNEPLLEAWRRADARSTVRHNQLHQARAQPASDGLAELARLAAEADRELAARERELASHSPLLLLPAAWRHEPELAGRIAGALPADTVLVVYRLHDDGLLVWAVTSAGVVVAEDLAVDVNPVVERIRLMRGACARLTDEWHDHAASLAETLLAPIAAVLRKHRRVMIVPSGPLHGLPFTALPLAGQPLVAEHEVSFLPAAFLAAEHAPSTGQDGPVTAFGDPGSPSPLPWARKEAETITAAGGIAHVGAAVTKQAVLAALRQPGVVHIACHGRFDHAVPLNSGLWLAEGDTLTVADLMGTRIRAGLVVLTACGAGRGSATNGEDVIGLPRGLLVGGAGAVVAPLWDVHEFPTAQLATALHERLRAGAPVTAALRDAQNGMREGKYGTPGRLPGFWAALTVVENPTTAPQYRRTPQDTGGP